MLICVTNRKLCKEDFLTRIEQLAKGHPHALMLREKDLSLSEYKNLAIKVKEICDVHNVPLIVNKNIETAQKLKLANIHLSLPDLRLHKDEVTKFVVGASIHSLAEAQKAQELGASYLVAGHIFPTDCKKGVPPRGLLFLKEVASSVKIPVFAIGGITTDNVYNVIQAGAKGVCIMSEAMTCTNPIDFVKSF